MPAKYCLECQAILHGRTDKKFCHSQCRNEYHNKINSEANKRFRNVNRILRNNYRILSQLNPDKKRVTIKQIELQKMGFSFNYFTHVEEVSQESVYFFCYEYGYLPLENDYFALVHDLHELE